MTGNLFSSPHPGSLREKEENRCAQRNRISVGNTKQDKAVRAVNKIIERDRQNRERSAQILDCYRNRKA